MKRRKRACKAVVSIHRQLRLVALVSMVADWMYEDGEQLSSLSASEKEFIQLARDVRELAVATNSRHPSLSPILLHHQHPRQYEYLCIRSDEKTQSLKIDRPIKKNGPDDDLGSADLADSSVIEVKLCSITLGPILTSLTQVPSEKQTFDVSVISAPKARNGVHTGWIPITYELSCSACLVVDLHQFADHPLKKYEPPLFRYKC
ncbi:hypothetical protein PGT21_020529 [Puccinia graminis f. sp. tritici]|uniref:Uncharacterized protein n=1 Tax=Puccinia graminis f. sp. tritici TaxID=56615 RepID=A0A5B0N2T8_PUCGR|nr:hypothetical protein PGT21_020529 [Puccinia graminis f. sp. tritici]